MVGALITGGASCTVPYVHEAEAARFPFRNDGKAKLIKVSDLSDEAQVAKVYQAATPWASIHIAGGFAMGEVAKTDKAALMAQLDNNLISCFLCCRAAVNAMRACGGGRIVNVAARPALEWRSGAGMAAYTVAKAGVAALTVALAEEVAKDGILVNAVAPSIMDTAANRTAMPKADLRCLAEGGRGGGDDSVSGLAGQQGHARRDRAGVRESVPRKLRTIRKRTSSPSGRARRCTFGAAQQTLHRVGGDHGAPSA